MHRGKAAASVSKGSGRERRQQAVRAVLHTCLPFGTGAGLQPVPSLIDSVQLAVRAWRVFVTAIVLDSLDNQSVGPGDLRDLCTRTCSRG